jgi:hypothetical protein
MDSDDQAAAERQWRWEEQRRQRYQAVLDRWVADQRADLEEERRLWRELDPFKYGHWNGGSRSR